MASLKVLWTTRTSGPQTYYLVLTDLFQSVTKDQPRDTMFLVKKKETFHASSRILDQENKKSSSSPPFPKYQSTVVELGGEDVSLCVRTVSSPHPNQKHSGPFSSNDPYTPPVSFCYQKFRYLLGFLVHDQWTMVRYLDTGIPSTSLINLTFLNPFIELCFLFSFCILRWGTGVQDYRGHDPCHVPCIDDDFGANDSLT